MKKKPSKSSRASNKAAPPCSAILQTVNEAVRFVLHATCLASIDDGQAGDQAAKMIVERVAQRLPNSVDDKASLAHALRHLTANKIAEPGMSGWYCGNRAQFVRRHKKAIALMRQLLSS